MQYTQQEWREYVDKYLYRKPKDGNIQMLNKKIWDTSDFIISECFYLKYALKAIRNKGYMAYYQFDKNSGNFNIFNGMKGNVLEVKMFIHDYGSSSLPASTGTSFKVRVERKGYHIAVLGKHASIDINDITYKNTFKLEDISEHMDFMHNNKFINWLEERIVEIVSYSLRYK